MSVALTNLRNAIATNTLTALQQAALTQALDNIIPTFPEPDPSGVAQPPPDEDDSREWIAALYTIQAEGGAGGGGPVTVPVIIASDGPTLTAIPVVGLPNGQPAVVDSFGAEFSLQPIDGMTVDGSTVLASPDVARVWERGDTVIAEAALLQATWVIDPQNASTLASNGNTGIDAAHPLLNVAEVMRRLGTWLPEWSIIVEILFLSASPADGSDPVLFTPNFKGGNARLVIGTSNPPTSFTGTLLAVTPKNHATNTGLSSTVTTATGAAAAGQLWINTTRANSRAFVQRDLGAAHWALDQPFLPGNAIAGDQGGGAVDTWANGDTIQGFVLTAVDIPLQGGTVAEFNADGGFMYVISGVRLFDPPGIGNMDQTTVTGACFPLHQDCAFERTLVVAQPGTFGVSVNCSFRQLIPFQTLPGWEFSGGDAGGSSALPLGSSQWFSDGCIFQSDIRITQPRGIFRNSVLTGGVMLDRPGTHIFSGQTDGETSPGVTLYGSGQASQQQGTFRYSGTATVNLPTSGGLALNNVPTGYSRVTVAGVTTIHGGIALTAANLDAAAGAAGFGGFAEGGGAFFNLNGVQP